MDEGSSAALVASSNYEGIVRAAHARHAWTFATETVALTLEGAVSSGNFAWSWLWPPEVINIRWAQVGGRKLGGSEYTIQGKRILTVSPTQPQIVATVRANEGLWPDDFAEAVVVRLQGLFIESLADKWQDGRLKIKDSEILFQAAIVRDKRQAPGSPIVTSPLASAWRCRGARPI